MPFTIEWCVPDIVIFVRVFGALTADEINTLGSHIIAFNDQSTYDPLYLLVDVEGIERLELTMDHAIHLPNISALIDHPKGGWIAYYSATHPHFQYMLGLWNQVIRPRNFFFADRAEAVAFLISKGAPLEEDD